MNKSDLYPLRPKPTKMNELFFQIRISDSAMAGQSRGPVRSNWPQNKMPPFSTRGAKEAEGECPGLIEKPEKITPGRN